MNQNSGSQDAAHPYSSDSGVSLESILCTEELQRRPPRPADYEKENRALVALGQALADSPRTVLQTLADTILEVCQAGSAGISLLTTDDGGKRFYWPAIAGKWKSHIGGGTPRDFGPCGDVLDRKTALLFSHLERRYTYFQPVKPLVEEALLVPFYVGGKAVGTIWAVAHDARRKFDAEDERIMRSLGKFASSAYQVVASLDALQFQISEREKAEGSLRDFVETATIPLHWVGPDGNIIWANQAELELLGYAREEYVGHHITEFHADPSVISDILSRLVRGETVQDQEARLRCKDGSIRHVLINSSGLFEKDKFIHSRCVTRDITKEKHAERVTGLLAAIVDSSDDAIISKSLSGIITSWNKSAERMFGYTAEEAIGQHIALIIPLDRRMEEITILERLKRGERVDHFETVRRRRDGTSLDISLTISPVKDGAGRVIGASKVARDITERRQAERALRESEEREKQITGEAFAANAKFRAVFEQTTVFAGIMTLDGVIVDANQLCLQGCGYRAEDVLGQLFWETGWWRGSQEVQDKIRAGTIQAAQGTPYREILTYYWADGTERLLDFSLHPIRDHRGQIIFLHPTGVDITELKRTEENYRALAETLDAEVRIRTEQLEQRNLEVLQQSKQLRELSKRLLQTQDEERRRIARDLHDSAGQIVTALGMNLASITRRVGRETDIGKIAEETHELVHQLSKEIRTLSYLLHPPLLDENGLSDAIRWYMQGLAERSGLKFALDIPEDFGRLPDDMEVAIFRIVQECLTNIHRHSGGKTATIRLARDKENVFLEIQDDGTGIPDETLAAIRTQRSGVGTTGMRERVGHFRGTIDIQSNSNGTKISVTFPLSGTGSSDLDVTDQQASAGE